MYIWHLGWISNFWTHFRCCQSMGNSISCPYWHSKLKKQFCRLDHYVRYVRTPSFFLGFSLRHICMLPLAPFSLLFRIEFHARLTIDLAIALEFYSFFLFFFEDSRNVENWRVGTSTRNIIHEKSRPKSTIIPTLVLFHPLQNTGSAAACFLHFFF